MNSNSTKDKAKPNMSGQFDVQDFEIVSRKAIFTGFLRLQQLEVRHKLFAGGWSKNIQRELLIRGQAVGVLLFDPARDELVLVRQFRVGLVDEGQSPWLLEIVAGMVNEGEELQEVAKRESLEESDCMPAQLRRIGHYYNSPGVSNEKITLYCGQVDAEKAGGIHGLADEHEDIEVVVLSYADAIAALNSGAIDNAMTIISLQWLQLHKQELLDNW